MIRGPLPQARAWPGLKKAVEARDGHATRIETSTGAGVPDTNVCWPGCPDVWVELKYGYDKPTPLQEVWHKKRTDAGGRVVVLTFEPGCVTIQGEWGDASLAYPCEWNQILTEIERLA